MVEQLMTWESEFQNGVYVYLEQILAFLHQIQQNMDIDIYLNMFTDKLIYVILEFLAWEKLYDFTKWFLSLWEVNLCPNIDFLLIKPISQKDIEPGYYGYYQNKKVKINDEPECDEQCVKIINSVIAWC